MSILDVLVETDDIVVLGPPAQVDISLDIGEKGERGSRFFVGYGDPNFPDVIPSGETPILGDVFVNASVASRYAWLYVYLRTPSGNSWIPALRLQPPIYAGNNLIVFNDGVGVVSVPLANILADNIITDIEKYTVNITATKENPVAISVISKEILGSNFVVTLTAAEFNAGAWNTLSGSVPLGVTIAVV